MIAAHRDLSTRMGGYLTDQWKSAFEATPRHLFVPDRALVSVNGQKMLIDRQTDPDTWIDTIYQDAVIITQLDDGADHGPGLSTSSCSMPQVVLSMLTALNVADGHRALEIGTGTGYNAALLAYHLGAENVISIEIDPRIAAQARTNLAQVNRPVTVITGDGVAGYPTGAPFDRIISTASTLAGQVPYTWVQHTTPGGVILTPWGTTFRNGELIALTVQPDQTAQGRIVDAVEFMRLHSHRTPLGAPQLSELIDQSTSAIDSVTTLSPTEITTDADAEFTLGLFLTDVQTSIARDDEQPDTYELLLYDVTTESAATVQVNPHYTNQDAFPVRQHGPRRLWGEAETAHTWWTKHGRPARSRYGLTLTPHTQVIWLDEPDNTVVVSKER